MISRPSLFQPPSLAAWLVDLFIPAEHAESITGDLLRTNRELIRPKPLSQYTIGFLSFGDGA